MARLGGNGAKDRPRGEVWRVVPRRRQVVEPVAKLPISLRVDADVLDWFKAQGPRYQSRINAVLRSFMTQSAGSRRKAG